MNPVQSTDTSRAKHLNEVISHQRAQNISRILFDLNIHNGWATLSNKSNACCRFAVIRTTTYDLFWLVRVKQTHAKGTSGVVYVVLQFYFYSREINPCQVFVCFQIDKKRKIKKFFGRQMRKEKRKKWFMRGER